MKKMIILFVSAAFIIAGCNSGNNGKNIYNGRLDTDIIRLSAQTAGNIDSLKIEEGDPVSKGQLLVKINTDKAEAQMRRQNAQLDELNVNLLTLNAQIKQVKTQLNFAVETLKKTEKMLIEGAATEQRRDELATQVSVYQAQLEALKSNYQIIASKKAQLAATMELTEISINDAQIKSPINGIVINKFHYENELVSPGRVVLEVADLSSMEATIYAPLADLSKIKIGQPVQILADGAEQPFEGKVKWIASESEFTPKTILTKETRTTLVYAVKIAVPNKEGILKIGMPVDVEF
jgi:HlyD family secretion protein